MKAGGTSCWAWLGLRAGLSLEGLGFNLVGLGLGNPPPWEHGLEGRLLQAGLGLRGAEFVLLWWQVTTPQRRDRILGNTKEADLGYPEIKLNQINL